MLGELRNNMVKKKKKTITRFRKKLPFTKEPKIINFKGITREELSKRLSSRKEQTAKKILASPGASPSAKSSARKVLGL